MTIPGLECVSPHGAFYAYPCCEGLIGKHTPAGTVIRTDGDFAEYLLESQGVPVVTGSPYGLRPYFRIALAVSDDGSSLKRAASVQPADPAPTTI